MFYCMSGHFSAKNMNQFLEDLKEFGLFEMPPQWIENVVTEEYRVYGAIPEEVWLPDDILESVTKVVHSFETWLNDTEDEREKSWHTLKEVVEPQRFMAVLGLYMNESCDGRDDQEKMKLAIMCARMYSKLLVLPRNEILNIYHEHLFASALTCLKFVYRMCEKKAHSSQVGDIIQYLGPYVPDLIAAVATRPLTIENVDDIFLALLEVNHCASAFIYDDNPLLSHIINEVHQSIITFIEEKLSDNIESSINKLFKYIFSHMSILDRRKYHDDICLSYKSQIKCMIVAYREQALSALVCLMQLLAYRLDDKAETRAFRVIAVTRFFALLPCDMKNDYLDWVIKLTKFNRVGPRQVGIEILHTFVTMADDNLYEPPLVPVQDENLEGEEGPSNNVYNYSTEPYVLNHSELIQAIFSRIVDNSPVLRTRVGNIMSEYIESQNENIRHAILEMSNSENAIDTIVLKIVHDQRATMRKAALHMIHKLIENYENQVTEQHYNALKRACRDCSILVRTTAIVIVFDICHNRHVSLDIYMDGPLMQISDQDNKVQEIVTKQIKTFLLEPLTNLKAGSRYPWQFVESIIQCNKYYYLDRAFEWGRTIDNIDKTIGTLVQILNKHEESPRRKLHCLVIMNAISGRVSEQFDASFLIKFYYYVFDSSETHSAFLVKTLFQLMTKWRQYMPEDKKSELYDHVLANLQETGIWNVEGVRRVCANFLVKVNPDRLAWVGDLIRKYEDLVFSGESTYDTWLAIGDMAQVSPADPSYEFIKYVTEALSIKKIETWDGCMVIALGRMACKSRRIAGNVAHVFGRVFAASSAPLAARVNAIHALTDISTRHAGILEPLMPSLSRTLSHDSPPLLRQTISESFTQLLLGDYLKLRRPFVNRYWLLMFDQDEEVNGPVRYYLDTVHKNLVVAYDLLQCIQDYNGYPEVTMDVEVSEVLRHKVYNAMWSRLSTKEKWGFQRRVGEDIFKLAALNSERSNPGSEGLKPKLLAVLMDIMKIISKPNLRPNPNSDDGEEEMEHTVDPVTNSSKAKMKTADVIISSALKFFTLVHDTDSPLVELLKKMINDLLVEYKNEVTRLLEFDAEFAELLNECREHLGLPPAAPLGRPSQLLSPPPEEAQEPAENDGTPGRSPRRGRGGTGRGRGGSGRGRPARGTPRTFRARRPRGRSIRN